MVLVKAWRTKCTKLFGIFSMSLLNFMMHVVYSLHVGILTASVPRVIREGQLQIRRLTSMTKEIDSFSRLEKMQLEYVFVWFLAKTGFAIDNHYGYKG
jgi:hypothetical protein